MSIDIYSPRRSFEIVSPAQAIDNIAAYLDELRITEDGETRITEEGEERYAEGATEIIARTIYSPQRSFTIISPRRTE